MKLRIGTIVLVLTSLALGCPSASTNPPIAPSVNTFDINSGASKTTSRSITLDNTCTGSPTEYIASELPEFNGANWQDYETAPVFELSNGNGTKTVYLKTRNNQGESGTVSDTIVLDSTPAPAVGSFNINSGAAMTAVRDVTLNNACTGSPTHYMASENPSFAGVSWEAYNLAPSFTLSPGNGTKTVYFKTRNTVGESAAASDTIELNANTWAEVLGSYQDDEATSVVATGDGGCAVVGNTLGGKDVYLAILDDRGDELWPARTYGGPNEDTAKRIIETSDGGFALIGSTHTLDRGWQMNFIKTEASGVESWKKTYGHPYDTLGYDVIETDEGYALAGYENANNDPQSYGGGYDMYLVFTNAQGALDPAMPDRHYGEYSWDKAFAFARTADDGFLLVGMTYSYGKGGDGLIVRTDQYGNMQSDSPVTAGGDSYDELRDIKPTKDGGFIAAGVTKSFRDGQQDAFLVKLGATGQVIWQNNYNNKSGGDEEANSVIEMDDGGFLLAGSIELPSLHKTKAFVVKTNADGEVDGSGWTKTFAASDNDGFQAVCRAQDGGLLFVGWSEYPRGTDTNFYVVKTDASGYGPSVPQ